MPAPGIRMWTPAVGEMVEVKSVEKGYRGAWFRVEVIASIKMLSRTSARRAAVYSSIQLACLHCSDEMMWNGGNRVVVLFVVVSGQASIKLMIVLLRAMKVLVVKDNSRNPECRFAYVDFIDEGTLFRLTFINP